MACYYWYTLYIPVYSCILLLFLCMHAGPYSALASCYPTLVGVWL